MKYKILSAVIAATLLNGCIGSDDPTTSVQAFDPAVAGMNTSFVCTDGTTGTAGVTDGYGNVTITNNYFVFHADQCETTFVGSAAAVDMSNGKSMAGVTYTIPVGMAVAGQKATGSPLSTLLAKTLAGAPYTEEAATQLLTDLGLGDLINETGTNVLDLFLDTEVAVAALPAEQKSKILATTTVISDTMTENPDATAATLTTTSKKVTDAVLVDLPAYPLDATGTAVYVDVKEISKTVVVAVVAEEEVVIVIPEPVVAVTDLDPEVPPTTPPTGGTGGAGDGADDGTGA